MTKYTRRKFLSQAFLTSLGGMFLNCSKKQPTKTNPQKQIIVIGAGIAGLAAASTLTTAGYNVTVLEASDRIGGRIHSVNFNGFTADLGASWIHGIINNPLYLLAGTHGFQTTPTYYDPSYIYDIDGEEVTDGEWVIIEDLLSLLVDLSYDHPDSSIQDLVDLMAPNLNLSEKMKRTFLGAVRSEIEIPYAADADKLSASILATDDSFPGDDVIFPNGMGQLTAKLAEGLSIKFNTYVSKISYDQTKVTVHTMDPERLNPSRACVACHSNSSASTIEATDTFSTDKVVVALPLAKLKNDIVTFEPDLPSNKQAAIQNIGIGTMNKIFLYFSDRFWPKDAYFLEYLKQNPADIMEFTALAPTGINNVLIAVLCGDQARQIENMVSQDIIQLAMDDLKGMFGSDIPSPDLMLNTNWHTNVFALGAYPYIPPGSSLFSCSTLAEPIGEKLFFAGDATSKEYLSTAHGAYLSGIRAAEEVIKN